MSLVWHYTDAYGLLAILRGHVLWATSSRFLNDASEVSLGRDLLVAELERRRDQDPTYRLLHELITAEVDTASPSPAEFFVLSAAQDWDLLAMWRSYGGRGESYAIGLDRSAPLAALVDDTGTGLPTVPGPLPQVRQRPWSPVRYGPAEQQEVVDAVFARLDAGIARLAAARETGLARSAGASAVDGASAAGVPPQVVAEMMAFLDDVEQAMLLSKHGGFVDEREIRHSTVVFRGNPAGSPLTAFGASDDPATSTLPPGLIQFRATPYGLAPYVRLTGAPDGAAVALAPSPLPIRALAVSPSGNAGASAETLRELLVSLGYPALPVHVSSIPFRE
ncbi:hypothetical protein C8046_10965 [Serinibacter arcticus]|uniref:DUF2971 domain-containing protein n=1 Tax=Serinibacter arcticus TaxID=1655435 RepID=A0A2U1ZVX5_9MICO|nr:hypothetical protein [Serinibacter arcticus]PWD51090.1 hypothetical protein C8046_10965 [Serinibacter arcticus]